MQRSYLTLMFSIQIFVAITHIVILLVDDDSFKSSVIPDVLIYAFSLPLFIILLLPTFDNDISNKWKPFVCSFLAIMSQTMSDLSIPIYHAIQDTHDFIKPLRPMYASHNLLIIYIFLPITDNVIVCIMGLMTTLFYLIVMTFVSYAHEEYMVVKILSEFFFFMCINLMGLFFRLTNEIDIRRTFIDRRECVQKNLSLKFERNQEKALLLSILPEHIAEKMEKDIKNMIEKLKQRKRDRSLSNIVEPRNLGVSTLFPLSKRQWSATNKLYAERHSDVSILYADVVNFTQMTTQLPVRLLVETLHELFVKFDEASAEHNVLRIKFLGDCYYCVSGVPIKNKRHAKNCVELGLQMIKDIRELRMERHLDIDMRIGIHSGSIIGGVMGSNKWQYDIWSKDVVIANKIESTGVSGKIHITHKTLALLHGEYAVEPGTDAAQNDPLLLQNNIKTFLISPFFDQFDEISRNGLTRTTSVSQLSHFEQSVIKKNFMQNSMEQFRDIMRQTNIELERELERMPIGKFQILKFFNFRKIEPEIPATTFYGRDSFSEPEDFGYQGQKMNQISKFFLRFRRNRNWELPFLNEPDYLLKYSMMMSFIVLSIILTIQVINRSMSAMFFVYTSISAILMFALVVIIWYKKIWDIFSPVLDADPTMIRTPDSSFNRKIYGFSYNIMSSAIWRTIIYLFVVSILFVVSLLHLIEGCSDYIKEAETQERSNVSYHDDSIFTDDYPLCLNSWSVTHCIVLTISISFLFLRIHFILKLLVALIIDGTYYYVIFYRYGSIYEVGATVNTNLDPRIAHYFKVIVATVIFHLIDRHSEYIQRVGFIWKQQLLEKKEMAVLTKETNKILVYNLLPVHVAELYLSQQYRNDLYSEEYENVAVMFATIMNLNPSADTMESEHSILKNFNEIICAFDEKLMTFGAYQKVEKIKVAGWSYMAACGLDPGRGDSTNSYKGLADGRRSLNMNLISRTPEVRKQKISLRQSNNVVLILVEFALELMRVLKQICDENDNFKNRCSLQLRVGISHGKVMAGVIGASKPLYDIWGNSVNMASRMDSTGIPGSIQVSQLVNFLLKCKKLFFEFR
ncbi:hypothetical protein ACKWTF_003787 [Chironomus riparius]